MPDPIARSYLSAAGREELPALTGLRILAALAVAVWHSDRLQPALLAPFTHGYLGVDLFFILSGFIIAHVYWGDFEQPTRHGYFRFVALRLARLWPAHIAVVLLFVLMNVVAGHRRDVALDFSPLQLELVLHLFLAHNWGPLSETAMNFPSWSVSAEFLAYLLFPLQVMLFRRIDNRWLLLACVPAALLLCWLGLTVLLEKPLGYAGPLANLRVICEFAMGVALFRLWRGGHFAHLPWMAIIAACIVAILAIAALTPPRHILDYAIVLLMAPVLLGLAHGGGIFSRVLGWRPFVYLGEISYSFYLMHIAALFFTKFLVNQAQFLFAGRVRGWDIFALYLLIAFLCAAALFHVVEKPARLWLRARIDRHMPALKPVAA
jgi:peptidoglycan/LPS O-acetylase OafA/YrhL